MIHFLCPHAGFTLTRMHAHFEKSGGSVIYPQAVLVSRFLRSCYVIIEYVVLIYQRTCFVILMCVTVFQSLPPAIIVYQWLLRTCRFCNYVLLK